MADATDTTDVADSTAVDRLTAHLMELDLDTQTLEMVMAALTVEVCDHVEPTDT